MPFLTRSSTLVPSVLGVTLVAVAMLGWLVGSALGDLIFIGADAAEIVAARYGW